MTIAKRLIFLLSVPLLILLGIGVFERHQLARIEERARFVTGSRVVALARLGDISRTFGEMRVNVRSFLLAPDASAQAQARAAYAADEDKMNRLLKDYADKRTSSDKGRRFLTDFRIKGQVICAVLCAQMHHPLSTRHQPPNAGASRSDWFNHALHRRK
jgi:hypothetical protein